MIHVSVPCTCTHSLHQFGDDAEASMDDSYFGTTIARGTATAARTGTAQLSLLLLLIFLTDRLPSGESFGTVHENDTRGKTESIITSTAHVHILLC